MSAVVGSCHKTMDFETVCVIHKNSHPVNLLRGRIITQAGLYEGIANLS